MTLFSKNSKLEKPQRSTNDIPGMGFAGGRQGDDPVTEAHPDPPTISGGDLAFEDLSRK
jgi:hypothetical protein